MTLKFTVNGQCIVRTDAERPSSGSRGYLHAQFDFNTDWDNLTKAGVFTGTDGTSHEIQLDASDTCLVPWEAIDAGYMAVSVRGDSVSGDTVFLPTSAAQVYVDSAGAVEGETPANPTPSVYAQLLNSLHEPYIGLNGNWYVWDTTTGAFVDSGTPSSAASEPYVTSQKNIASGIVGLDENAEMPVAQMPSDITKRSRLREPLSAKQLTLSLKEGLRSIAIFTIGDSVSCGVTSWPGLFAAKLATKFPAYNVKYADYVTASSKYGAWQDLVTAGGAERHLAIVSVKQCPVLTKAEIPLTSPDMDVEIRFSLDNWALAADKTILARYGINAGERCWYIWLGSDSIMNLTWTEDGTTLKTARFNFGGFGTNVAGQAYWFRYTLDVDDGAGHYVAKLYTSTDGVTWTTRQTITGASTTSVYDHATQGYTLGGTTGSSSINGKIYEVRINDGIDGYNVCPQPVESWKQAATTVNYAATIGGAPTIYFYNGAVTGSGVATYTAALLSKVIKRCFDPLVIISLSHNDGGLLMGEPYYTSLAGLTTEIKKLVTQPMLCYLLENPKTAPADFILTHSRRIAQQLSYALNNNYDVIDNFTEFNLDSRGLTALVNPADGVHPTAAGKQLMADVMWDYFNILNL